MSSAVISTPAAQGRPFAFDGEAEPEVRLLINLPSVQETPLTRVQSAIKNQQSKIRSASVTPASQLQIRPAPEMGSSGVPAIDRLTGGLPRGCLTEVCGPPSSGRTTLLLAALAAATRRGEFCVIVDASDALDPQSAVAAGVELERLLWVRCGEDSPLQGTSANQNGAAAAPSLPGSLRQGWGIPTEKILSERRIEQVLRATDLLLESGGFGLIVLDLGDLPPQFARRIPLTTWFRYRRAIEHTPTILLAIEPQAIAGSCSSLLLQLGAADKVAAERRKNICRTGQTTFNSPYPTHAHLLTGLNINAELIRSRLDRKPTRSVAFATKTAWAG